MTKDLLYKNRVIGQIPSSWAKVKIDQNLVDILGGFSCPKSRAIASGLPHFRPFNITTEGEVVYTPDTVHIPNDYQTGVDRYFLLEGDVLFNNTNSVELVGKTGIVRQPMQVAFSNHINRLRVRNREQIDPKWLALFLRDLQSRGFFAANCNKWIGQAGFSVDSLSEVDIPLPDIGIQRQIVARIEALLSEVREMREINQRIIEDTQQLLGAFLNQTFENLPGKENKTIDEVGYVKGGKRLPKGESFAAQPTPYPYLRVTDFRNFGIDESDLRYLTPEVHTQIRNYIISDQDVFISIAGTIGLVGTVPAHLSGSNLTENAAKIVFRPEYQDKIKNKYLMYFLASPQGKKQIEARTKAAGQPKLALERIKTITFPYIDSIPQQEAIIEKIEAVQSEVTEMLRTQQADEKLISQVEESILSQAFQGNL